MNDIKKLKEEMRIMRKRIRELEKSVVENTKIEILLKESEGRFRLLFENAPDPMYLHSLTGEFIDGNQAAEELIGYKKKALIGKHILKSGLITKKNLVFARQLLAKSARGEKTGPDQMEVIRRDGKKIWIEINSVPLNFGKKSVVLDMVRDISLRKKTELAWQKSQSRMASIFRAAPIGIGVVSNRVLLEMNDQLTKVIGYKRDELVGKNVRIIYPTDEEYEFVGRETYKQIKERGIGTVETRLKHKNGKIIDVLLSSTTLDPNNISEEGTFTVLDITQRKKVVEELHASEDKFRTLFQNSPDMYISVSPVDATILLCNETLATKTGYSLDELVGSSIFNIYHDDCKVEAVKSFTQFKQTGLIRDKELILKKKDGNRLEISLNADAVRDKEGNILYSISTWRDITKQKQVERELENHRHRQEELVKERTNELERNLQKLKKSQRAMLYMVEDLNKTSRELKTAQDKLLVKERLATLGQFSGNISHELRNPLGVISSSVYYLKTVLTKSNKKVQEHLQKIGASVDTASTIIQSLLNLTRMKKPAMVKTNLISVIFAALKSTSIPADVKVVHKLPSEKLVVKGEVEQIRIALKNIFKNAVESIENCGTLTIKAAKCENSAARLTIKDTGTGISPEDLNKVFQPLFSTKIHGIGFGLSITKMIFDNHGGSIKVKSVPGKGTTFILYLPLYRQRKK